MTTTVNYLGSKWAGEEPDSIDTLFERLTTEPLDPTFEEYGNFATNDGGGMVRFWGNFYTLSSVFSIDTDDADLIVRLMAAIRTNQATDAYRDAKNEWYENRDAKDARDTERQQSAQRRREMR